ncbi:uncharacterized protein LAESUDRAFT_764302 [Laetiporus sulphureus 93-53]|uniref:G-protein coupled receptors family 1 profile domain-containing protein n=1 Tax=Laetiporus sulphureus 93-53 TaxID=1314785 RepID=A0A165BCX5_9APHY|nr:uncharacterized protein LAESUDRAFT_764302 [Laetiporus sulphureus 93-53]KZT00768.1 hypothetical protein LAESUDRAFT_764302 [Laetiporus sulphureus 93-53]
MAKFLIAEAELVAIFTESITYGIHISTFTTCMWTLLRRPKGLERHVNVTLLLFSITLFILGTLDIAFNFYRNLTAFIFYTGPGGASHVFEELSNWVNAARSAFNVFAFVVADAIQVYRLWIVYSRNWRVAFPPLFLWLAGMSCGISVVYYGATLNLLTDLSGATILDNFLDAFLVLSVSVNVITTGLTLYRILMIHRSTSRYFPNNSGSTVRATVTWTQLFRILIESALLYTVISIIFLIVNLTGNNAVYCVSDMSLQIAGIQFDLIIVRVGMGITMEQEHTRLESMNFRMQRTSTARTDHGLDVPVVITQSTTTTTRTGEESDRKSVKAGSFPHEGSDAV